MLCDLCEGHRSTRSRRRIHQLAQGYVFVVVDTRAHRHSHGRKYIRSLHRVALSNQEGPVFAALHKQPFGLHPIDVLVVPRPTTRARHLCGLATIEGLKLAKRSHCLLLLLCTAYGILAGDLRKPARGHLVRTPQASTSHLRKFSE